MQNIPQQHPCSNEGYKIAVVATILTDISDLLSSKSSGSHDDIHYYKNYFKFCFYMESVLYDLLLLILHDLLLNGKKNCELGSNPAILPLASYRLLFCKSNLFTSSYYLLIIYQEGFLKFYIKRDRDRSRDCI